MTRRRYRARVEHGGVEVFDRLEGRATQVGLEALQPLRSLSAGPPREPAGALDDLGLWRDGQWDVEPLIDTPFEKTGTFASAPRRLYWELTRRCNLNCRSCYNRTTGDRAELPLAALLAIARQAYEAGVWEVRCTGGEPTVREDFADITHALADLGFYLSLGTNGVYSKQQLELVLRAPLSWVILSIDGGTAEVHESIRGVGTYAPAVDTLRALSEGVGRVRVNTLIRKEHHTYEDLGLLAVLCDEFRVESLNCIPLRPVTNDPLAVGSQLTASEFRCFIDALNRLRTEHKVEFVTTLDLRHTASHDRVYFKDRSCAAGREGAVISPDGEIYGCSYSPASDPSLPPERRGPYVAGDLTRESFLDVWNDSARWSIFRDLDRYKHARCRACAYYLSHRCIGNCPIMVEGDPAAFDPYCYLHLHDRAADQGGDGCNE